MAESQLRCLDEQHVNEKIPECRPEFRYSEEQRAALEQLLRHGDGAFKLRLRDDHTRDFLSAREVKVLRKSFQRYRPEEGEGEGEEARGPGGPGGPGGPCSADSGVHSTYWPQMSDAEVPALDVGWAGGGGAYRGVTRVSVYSHPPREPGPHIKEVVRRLIQEAQKVVAIVMDLLTDLQIIQDLLDSSARRGVAVYALLEAGGMAHFLDMCSRLQVNAVHLRKLRVRTVTGSGLALSFGKLPGSLSSKYMLVDGDKVVFGTYSFTWSCSRMDRSTITVMSGQIVDSFDTDFRELYAVSQQVDLYREFNITKPPVPAPVAKPQPEPAQPLPLSASRFQVSVNESRQTDLKVPAHKYHNPKYSLVFGNSRGFTGSLQDLSTATDLLGWKQDETDGRHRLTGDQVSPPAAEGKDEDGKGSLKKKRSSFRQLLRGRGTNHITETIEEGVVAPQRPAPPQKGPETNGTSATELEVSFEPVEGPNPLISKFKKSSKGIQRSVSLQTINTGDDDDGPRSRRRSQKKNCIQS